MIGFRCDYLEGCHPSLLQALVDSNEEQCNGYGLDIYSQRAIEKIRNACEAEESQVHFIIGGTPANKTVLSWLLKPWQGVISVETGHIATHESGAIESTGHKVIALAGSQGKLSCEAVEAFCDAHFSASNKEHEVEPGAVYVSQPTEFGTIYSKQELMALRELCDRFGMALFVDGARLGYALASPENDVSLPDLARLCEVFYIGGTKCGALCGEAVVIRQDMGDHFRNIMKQSSGILAKGRILGLQFDALFTQGLYVEICGSAVEIALKIAKAFQDRGIPLYIPSGTNQQFPVLNQEQMAYFAQDFSYEFWEKLDEQRAVLRFCTSWATTPEQGAALIEKIKHCPL